MPGFFENGMEAMFSHGRRRNNRQVQLVELEGGYWLLPKHSPFPVALAAGGSHTGSFSSGRYFKPPTQELLVFQVRRPSTRLGLGSATSRGSAGIQNPRIVRGGISSTADHRYA